jgi:hypothetical protein
MQDDHRKSSHPVVLQVQKALNIVARRTVVAEDGIFSDQTFDELRLFQATHRIVATGAINNETIKLLNRGIAKVTELTEHDW